MLYYLALPQLCQYRLGNINVLAGQETVDSFPCLLFFVYLIYAKLMQMSTKRIHSQFVECSLTYAKLMQMSTKRIYSQFVECSLTYAKIQNFY